MGTGVTRRGFVAGAIAAVAGSALGAVPTTAAAKRAKRSLRVAYITDVHLEPTSQCVRGLVGCLRKIRALDDQPDLIIQGGDIIMDGLVRDAASVQRQFA